MRRELLLIGEMIEAAEQAQSLVADRDVAPARRLGRRRPRMALSIAGR
jgi:hypothetical protein